LVGKEYGKLKWRKVMPNVGFYDTGEVEFFNSEGVIWVRNRDQSVSDNFTVNDAHFNVPSAVKSDSLVVNDALVNNATINKSDTLIFDDAISSRSIVKDIQEQIILIDLTIKNIVASRQDALIINDALANNATINKSDTLTVADAINSRNALKTLQEQVELFDSIVSKSFVIQKNDIIRIIDAIEIHRIFMLALYDSINISDIYNKEAKPHFYDNIFLDDAYQRIVDYHRTYEDHLAIVDSLFTVLNKGILDLFRDMVLPQKIREVFCSLKIKEVVCSTKIRQVLCTPIHLQESTDMLTFSPKQNGEEYYNIFNFARVITPLTTMVTATVTVYDESGVDVSSTLLDTTKTKIIGTKVYAWVRGGSEQTYKLTCRITMSNEEKFEQDATMQVTEV
jgi:hypothetical protein